MKEATAVHHALGMAQDAGTKLVLTRPCLDVCKVMYLLRTGGRCLTASDFGTFDGSVHATLDRTVGGGLSDLG